MNSIMEASRIEMGNALLDLNEDQPDQPVDGFHMLDETTIEDDLGDIADVEVKVDVAYEVDYLQAMIAKEDVLKNMVAQSSAEHEATLAAMKTVRTAVCRHKVANRYWKPGKPLDVEVGQAVFVGISTPNPKVPIKNQKPKSFVGCLRAGMNKQQAREYLNACQPKAN